MVMGRRVYHGLSVALFESCACNHSEWDEAGEAEQEREGGLACFPFRSSRGPLSRHFIPSHHLSPHTTEAALRSFMHALPDVRCPSGCPSVVRHSKWSRHFICLHGNWNCSLPAFSPLHCLQSISRHQRRSVAKLRLQSAPSSPSPDRPRKWEWK